MIILISPFYAYMLFIYRTKYHRYIREQQSLVKVEWKLNILKCVYKIIILSAWGNFNNTNRLLFSHIELFNSQIYFYYITYNLLNQFYKLAKHNHHRHPYQLEDVFYLIALDDILKMYQLWLLVYIFMIYSSIQLIPLIFLKMN